MKYRTALPLYTVWFLLPILLFNVHPLNAQSMLTPFEKNNHSTATYEEIIRFYQQLDDKHASFQLREIGDTDSGKPLHACILDQRQIFRPDDRLVYFINNGIHPGEPCGVDASMMWVRDLLEKGSFPEDVVLVLIPVYNVGGALNRNSTSRVNQLGPESHGFRGNAKNLDLNRDFIKCDSKNAQSFNRFYSQWQPHIFVDTHTSNGADYQHTMTLINTQPDRLPKPMRNFLRETMHPFLYTEMQNRNWEMTPYVYTRETPDQGIYGFLDLPRYSSGYAALHHAYGFMPETHMLKPFADRVQSTYTILQVFLDFAKMHRTEIIQSIEEARSMISSMKSYPLKWALDDSRNTPIIFKGYEAAHKPSKVSGLPRLYYDHSRPFEKEIPWYEFYKAEREVKIPKAYYIPAAYEAIVQRLLWNGIQVDTLETERTFKGEIYHIQSFETVDMPYEGHYLHSDIKVSSSETEFTGQPHDFIVRVDQEGWRYILETLEPESPDSYFAWNFMDAILQRKEYFSSYVFEDVAAKMLEEDAELRKKLDQVLSEDPSMKENARAQLYFIYKNSQWSEDAYMKYPIARIMQ